ncbi:VOC family protein [Ulvibacter litoralis]|uniref:PhnB protein n=1 Tax=Ulvibacter litoralis TaxID=227084 RepID=A0A1G7C9N1_9FLAO|nr:VOC family protein [Ulvibacter litoralis]GHC48150.1 VOC family protein [Ulvibacter litoralis]SDE35913.1 PhnB protein [Ulvibacter litoralis]
MKIQSYLAFDGNCQEALKFYSTLFNATIQNKQTYKDAKMDIPEHYRDKLQHAELSGKGVHFMAYDAAPDTPITSGNQVHLSIDLTDKSEAETLFNDLSAEGKVHHDFKEREWGYFGRCTDKFGIHWMLNCEK